MRLSILNDFEERYKFVADSFSHKIEQRVSKKEFSGNREFLLEMNRRTKDKIIESKFVISWVVTDELSELEKNIAAATNADRLPFLIQSNKEWVFLRISDMRFLKD